MIFKQLSKFVDNYSSIKKRGSGISLKDLRYLSDLGIVNLVKLPLKNGKDPKNANAFELTMFGRDIIRQYNSGLISKSEILLKLNNDFKEVQSQVKSVQATLVGLNNQLQNMQRFLENFSTSSNKKLGTVKEEISDNELLDLLKTAQIQSPKSDKMGLLYSTEIYFKIIQDYSPLADKTISKRLYNLYEKNLLDLQMGPDHNGRAILSPSGKQFSWGNVVD